MEGESPNDHNVNAHQRAKALKIKLKKQGMASDQEDVDLAVASKRHQMRIASSGRNPSDKD
jgi:hypothetical protein